MEQAPVSVVIPTRNRPAQLLHTLGQISACEPQPAEIIVHLDRDDARTGQQVVGRYPSVIILSSRTQVGPGGGRNAAIAATRYPLVASFDDDSYPLDTDYFATLLRVCEQYPDAAVVSASIFHRGQPIRARSSASSWVADFTGCGCVYRRETFLQTAGYVPLVIAYGMEEVDLAMRLHARGERILHTRELRVFHDTLLQHHDDPWINGVSLANLALLTYLRYPAALWWLGAAQTMRRVFWCLKHRRAAGLLRGVLHIPRHLGAHRRFRAVISGRDLRTYLHLRHHPIPGMARGESSAGLE